jgi:phosphoribosylanthranilate isomerase
MTGARQEGTLWRRFPRREVAAFSITNREKRRSVMDTKVKICGLTKPAEAQMLNRYGADYAGFVMFCEKSKRNNTVQNAWQVLRYLDHKIQAVAVVVSPTLEQIRLIEQMDFQIIQIHGALSTELLEQIHLPVWRAYNITSALEQKGKDGQEELFAKEAEELKHPKITACVLDGGVPGSGRTFDWTAMERFPRGDCQLVLAGGLKEDNVREAIHTLHPDVVDVSSGVEGEQGKDALKVKNFIECVRFS